MKRLSRWWWILPAVVVVALGGAVLWALLVPSPMDEALDALQTGGGVDVSVDRWLVFRPADMEPNVGLILYPGGRVDPRAYAPTARAIAGEGYLVVIVPMPLNLAVLGAGRGAAVIDEFAGVEHWAIGGHSLGGAMAAKFAYDNAGLVDGLVLWASYPAGSNDLSRYDLVATSVYGTLDGLASEGEVVASWQLVPDGTRWVAIEGGNHAQFGWYGTQRGDGEATIDRQAQQAQIVAATLDVLARLQ